MTVDFISGLLFSVIRLATPLIFAGLAAAICNKAGLLNMAIESMMLFAALGGVLAAGLSGSVVLGLVGAVAVGMLVAFIIAFASFLGKADLYLTNIAMNLAAMGGTVFILFALTGEKSNTAGALQFGPLPLVDIPLFNQIPLLGRALSGHYILTYIALAAPFALSFFIYKTRLGLRIRSVGENPQAAESVGISVVRMQFTAYCISGGLAALGGAALTLQHITAFTRNMTAGRGYMGLAASNMVNGSPVGALFTALLFGTSDATVIALQMTDAPIDFLMMIPYIVTIVALVIISIVRQAREKRAVMKAVAKKQTG